MGIFGKKSGASDKLPATTIIASGCRITGTLQLTCDIQIDGHVEGKINSDKMVLISHEGCVKGDIFAERIVVNGMVKGSCYATAIEILEKGKITGSAFSDNLSIDRGGVFCGDVHPMETPKVSSIDKKSSPLVAPEKKSETA